MSTSFLGFEWSFDDLQVDIGVNYTFEKQHHFSAALNNVFDKGLEYDADGSNVYREFFDGRNVWLGYTYTFWLPLTYSSLLSQQTVSDAYRDIRAVCEVGSDKPER